MKFATRCKEKASPWNSGDFENVGNIMDQANGRNSHVSREKVRQFLLIRYSEGIKGMGLNPIDVPDNFDFLLSGVIDSFGILEMITSIEDEFRIKLDLAALDAEQITILGPLSRYVAENAKPN
jgi:acyl carrier protein